MPLLISGATLLDAVADKPIEGRSIWVQDGRIKAIGKRDELSVPPNTRIIDARGKYAIPGLMNANVHLVSDAKRLETFLRFRDRLEDLVAESAQLALKNGVTTVFDTMGLRKPLIATRDKIDRGEIPGSRIFCAGWIVGFDGPFSKDFFAKVPDVVSADLVTRVNSMAVENVGPSLMYMSPDQVRQEMRAYLKKGIDFIKYAGNEHLGPMLQFSERVQSVIVEEAHRAGTTAQAHTMAVEGIRVAIEAGCDLLAHANITGHFSIPEATLDLFAERKTGATVFPFTEQRLKVITSQGGELGALQRVFFENVDVNTRNLIRCGARLLLATDGSVRGPDLISDPRMKHAWVAPGEDNLGDLREGHFAWFKGMEERGCPPIAMLKAATRNIALAYGKDSDLGTLETGKIADILILDKNPLQSSENYRSINTIIKDGEIVDRDALPLERLLTRPLEPLPSEAVDYRRYTSEPFPFPPCC